MDKSLSVKMYYMERLLPMPVKSFSKTIRLPERLISQIKEQISSTGETESQYMRHAIQFRIDSERRLGRFKIKRKASKRLKLRG